MTLRWEDLITRVRGLGTHLLEPAQVAGLAAARDVPDLARRLAALGLHLAEAPGVPGPADLELGLRRLAGRRLHLLARWCGPRTFALRVVFEDEDRRSLRALVRGAAAGAAPAARLAGLIPTPAFPLRALDELAAQPHAGDIAALLAAWGSPWAPSILAHTGGTEPDLLALELAIARTFAERAREGARRGDRVLREFVAEAIELENLFTALLLAGAGHDIPASECFLAGGSRLPLRLYARAAGAPDSAAAAGLLAGALGGGLGDLVRRHAADPAALEEAVLPWRIHWLQARARLDPLSAAPVLLYALRIRDELIALQRVVWGAGLGAPADALVAAVAP